MPPKIPPKIPTRTDAFVECACGGIMSIATVAPIPDQPDFMRHIYHCNGCGADATFDVAKRLRASAGCGNDAGER